MADTIKCSCSSCGAKYRLPAEAQGRTARCKRCGEKFTVPQVEGTSLEDTVMSWLVVEDDGDDAPPAPKVINLPDAENEEGAEAARRMRGPIRLKGDEKAETKK